MISNLASHFCRTHAVRIIVLEDDQCQYRLDSRVRVTSLGLRPSFFYIVWRLIFLRSLNGPTLCFGHKISIVMSIVSLFRKCSVIACERNFPGAEPRAWLWMLGRAIFYRLATRIVVQTEAGEAVLRKLSLGVRISVIPNYVDDCIMRSLHAGADASAKDNTVIAFGSKPYQKGVDRAVKAFVQSGLANRGWTLRLIGVKDRDGLLSHLESYGLELNRSITMEAFSGEIGRTYNAAKLLIFASRYEGYPNGLIEAMASGVVPIVYMGNGYPAELISHGKNGFICTDVSDLTTTLVRLDKSEALRKELATNAKTNTKFPEQTKVHMAWLAIINSTQ